MFVLTPSRADRARLALSAVAAECSAGTHQVHEVDLGTHRLLWTRAQVRDNLHVHPDGVLIGRRSVDEPLSDAPLHHDEPLGANVPAAFTGVRIRTRPDVVVEPLGVTGVFVHGADASDRQLVLAAAAGLRPSPEGVAVLAAVGYFPGTLTLFDGIERIPFLHRWNASTRSSTPSRRIELPRPDDRAMVERLVEIVPRGGSHALGLSGGLDSRFVLGILRRAGAEVRIVRFTDGETEIVEQVAQQLGLEVQGIGDYSDRDGQRSPYQFTLMSDAQVWHGVAQHSRLRQHLAPLDLFHSGQFSGSIIKSAFKTAWKKPDPRTPFWDRLLLEGFLPNAPERQPALRGSASKTELLELLRGAVEHQRHYVEFRTRKQWANWIYYLNRGVRWAQGFHDDVTFSTNLVFLLSDVDAQLYGIASSAWANFNSDRLAALNAQLLPEVTVGYSSGRVSSPPGLRGAVHKLEYEYLTRLRTSRTARAGLASIANTYDDALPDEEPPGFDALFDRPMREVAEAGRFGLRRVNVTVANVLTFLDRVERAAATS